MGSLSVLTAAKLSELSYEGAAAFNSSKYKSDPTKQPIPDGWSFYKESVYDQANPYYYGVAFKNNTTGQIVVANRGTKEALSEFSVAYADGEIGRGKMPSEFDAAVRFARLVQQSDPNAELFLTGHSKGGAEAAYVATQIEGARACTFNAPGIGKLSDGGDYPFIGKPTYSNIDEYYVPGDVVSKIGSHIGNVHKLPEFELPDASDAAEFNAIDGIFLGVKMPTVLDLHSLPNIIKQLDPAWNYTPCGTVRSSLQYYLNDLPNTTYTGLRASVDPITGNTIYEATLYKSGNDQAIPFYMVEDSAGRIVETVINDISTALGKAGDAVLGFLDETGQAIDKMFLDADRKVISVQSGAAKAAAAQIGELFGSMLGKTVASGNPVAEIAAGTLLGLTMSKVGSVLEAGFSGDLPTLIGEASKASTQELGSKLGGVLSDDIITRLQGVGSSMLAAELAEALGISGFEGKVFTAVTQGVTSQFIKETVSLVSKGTFTLDTLFSNVLSSADMIRNIQGSLGGLAGSQLASMFVTPDSPEAQVFASVGSSIGAIVGAAGGVALGWVPFIGPFVGSFLGQLLTTWAANAWTDNDDEAYAQLGLSKESDKLGILAEWVGPKGGDIAIAHSLAKSTMDTVNGLLNETGLRLDRDKPFTVQVGYYNNSLDRQYSKTFTTLSPNQATTYEDQFYANKYGDKNPDALARTGQYAVAQVIDAMTVVGGDAVMRRAFYASREATGSTDKGLTRLGFDLQVAKDYRFFLDHEEVIKATMEAQKDSAYTASWTATLLRVNELGLNRGSVNDFKGGFYANLKVNEVVQGPRGMAGGLAPERLAWIPDLDSRDIAANRMKTGDLILTSADGLSSVRAEDVFGPGEVVTLTGANSTATVDGSTINKPDASVILIKAGDGDKTVKGSATQGSIIVGGKGVQTLTGGSGNDWLRAGDGRNQSGNSLLLGGGGDDLLAAGEGAPVLDGGSGRNTYYLGPDNATVRISALDKSGYDTVIGTLTGALSGATNTINVTAKGAVSGLSVTKDSAFARSGADLVIFTKTTDARDGVGKIVVENFFLSLKSIDTITFSDGTLQNIEIWDKVGARTLINETAWNTADETRDNILIDGADTQGDIYAAASTKTSDGTKSLFDIGIYDDGSMHTVAYDPSNEHDWAKWLTEYTTAGDIKAETVTLDAKNADGSAVVITRGTGGVVAGSGGDDVLRSATAGSTLIGDRGNDALSGSGGADLLYGGSGDDRYVVGAGDRVFEFTGQGTDLVETTVSYTLAAGQSIEELRLADSAGTTALNLTGNEFANTLVGNAGANSLNGGAGNDVLRGGGGNDTYTVDSADDQVFEGDSGGSDTILTTRSYVLMAGQEIETLQSATTTATTALNLTGNAFANSLIGNAGINVLDGGDGNDVLRGGAGDDTYLVDNASDQVFEAAAGGNDTVVSENSFTLAAGQAIETLRLANPAGTAARGLAGNEFANTLIGNAGANNLFGNGGSDILDGGDGNDVMRGGEGDDTYRVDNANDQVFEAADEGNDTVLSDNSFTLAAGQAIETLRITSATSVNNVGLAGNEFDNTLTGNAGANYLGGGGGNDTLDGGAGSDTMRGGLGNDVYVIDATGDTVTENAGEGTDGIRTTLASYTLGAEIENLRYYGGAAFTGTGNALANAVTGAGADDTLSGGAGNDVLNGLGGDDRLIGGTGNDTYVVDSTGDTVTEAAGGGIDELQTNLASYGLGAEVENLRYIGSADFSGTGNALDNTLTGRGGNDTLNGGAGDDVLQGGAGDDTYRVDNINDQVFEAEDGGRDTILSDNSFALAAGQEIEVLQLTFATGTAARGLSGNEFANTLIGNAGANNLNGGGGSDVLTGNGGSDTFQFRSALGSTNVDRITNFGSDDGILLDKAYMTGLSAGALGAGAFKNISQTAADADDRILYKQATGEVFYDADGSGSGAAVRFAILDNKAALSYQDFLVA